MTPFERAIADLGTTPEEVSAKLRSMGIKGYRFRSCDCPVAKYLKACGFPYVSVGCYAKRFSNDSMESNGQDEYVLLPKEVQNWIGQFDNCDYPEFIQSPY